MPENIPLLSFSAPTRKHFLDNLRAVLTVFLVLQHSIIETAISRNENPVPLSILVATNKAFLWSTFFFVSGYSTSLSLAFRSANARVFYEKALKITTPAIIYAMVGHFVLFYFLSTNWPYIFGNNTDISAYARFSGPVGYVLLLFIFDSAALIIRKITLPSWLRANTTPSTAIFFAFVALSGYTFLNAALLVPTIALPRFLTAFSYDTPTPSFPLSHIIAYFAGWQFRSLKRTILSSSTNSAIFGLVASTCLSVGSLSYAQAQWPAIATLIHIHPANETIPVFVDGGFNPHTIFFSLWTSFTFFTIPICLLSIFFHSDPTARSWGAFGKKTYIQTYIHMIPILMAEYHLRRVANAWVKYGLVAVVAVVGSWMIGFGIYATIYYVTRGYREARRRMRW